MKLAHFFHIYSSAGEWRDPVAEHLAALEDAGYDSPFHVAIVGSPTQRAEALNELRWIRQPDSITEADDGWEQITLHALHEHAKAQHSGAVLYAHTKGAHDPSTINIAWRQSMTHHVVKGWRDCVKAIGNRGVDAVGCHWLTPAQYSPMVSTPFFGGNFWWASVKYLRRLPQCATGSRHDAEMWIGLRNPRVVDLLPGWPGHDVFERRKARRLVAGLPA